MTNIIASSFDSWKANDFTALLKDLDTIACDIANEKDHSDVSRKVLIEKNKRFKEQVSLETRKEVAPLLKCFQAEVDSLNKRNKVLETQLLTIYKKLIDLPDPANALELAVKNHKKLQKSQDIALENKKLRETLEEYQQEFSTVKNQEVTIKQLRDRIKDLENNLTVSVDSKCKEIEREFANTFAEKERELVKDKLEAYYKLGEYENKLIFSDKNLVDCQSELFQMKNKFDELSAAKMSEMELLIVENERANERIEQLKNQLSNSEISKDNLVMLKKAGKPMTENEMEINEINELQMELNSKENEIIKLSEEIRNLNNHYTQNEKRMQFQIEQLENEVIEYKKSISKLQSDLQSQSDYEEIKKELSIIKSIEFQDFDPPHSPNNSSSTNSDESYVRTKSIEQLLNEKNRHLQNELLQNKASFTQIQMEFVKLKEEDNENRIKLKVQGQLINQLEDDLRNVKSIQISTRKLGDGSDDSSQNSIVDSNGQITKINEATILADVLESPDENLIETNQSSLLSIVQSQRDRFKNRSQELERNSQILQQTIQNLQLENDQIRNDNVKLYEKVRFLQSYSRTSKNQYDDNTMSRYSTEYEANINPFETFNRQERQRQYQALPPYEKIVLNLGKFVMSNRTARIFAFLYSLLMHFLIFGVLYKLAYTETCVRDQAFQCRKEFADHMKNAHGR